MIKLNNKNITYVALADTNTSLKAPKEIWYADSNNSVKLVYRRKDALIEGEDYEKYHWLRSDESAYIDTLINPSFGDELNATFTLLSKPTKINIYIFSATDNVSSIMFLTGGDFPKSGNPQLLIINKPSSINGYIEWNSASLGTTIKEYYMYMKINNAQMPDMIVKADGVICDYHSIVGDNRISEVPATTYKIGKGYSIQTGLDTVKLKNITISSKINLIPCKLLKPVPKWLDANGIRRQVGECGMIDLVSGKFYGNVNSVGTFTVENYYERKEWLQGRNGAYINTEYELTPFDDAFYVKAKYDGSIKNPDNDEQYVFGMRNYVSGTNRYYCVTLINALNKIAPRYCNLGSDNPATDETTNFEVFLSADTNYMYRTLNGVAYPAYSHDGTFVLKSDKTIYLFKANFTDSPQEAVNKYFHGDIASFRISDPTFTTDKMNLIPCTLTMDLPASMDANNIARTKGTSGMWDLVSDRFYGNVASSGTFKAVNLAEGVDYEIHDWLVANIPIGVMTMRLFVNQSSSVNYTVNITTTSNSIPLFRTAINGNKEDYVYFNNASKLNVWSYINGTSASVNTIYSNNGLYNIELSPSEFIINSISATKYGDAYTIVWYDNPNSSTVGVTSTSKITVDGIERYIPVKLLKSIPSKYDANGIARSAGECGMYDTVNDLFYGNVASSGSFTVSDDN